MQIKEIAPFIIESILNRQKEKNIVDEHHTEALGIELKKRGLIEAFPEQTGEITPELAAKIYAASPYVNAAVRIIANSISTVPLKVYMRERSGRHKEEKYTGYPYTLLEWANPYMTSSELIENLASWMVLNGNAYWCIDETPEEYLKYAPPISIYPLNPRFLKIVPDPDTHVTAYRYQVSGEKPIFIPAKQVVHFKNFNPYDHWHGHANLNSLISDMKIERWSKSQMANFYAQAAVVSGVLEIDGDPDDDEIRKIKREFYAQYGGNRNAYRVMILTNGMEYKPLGLNLGDFESVPILEQNLDIHATVLGVPVPILVGKSDNTKELLEAEALMWKKTIIPLGTSIAQTITKKLARPISDRLVIDFDYTNVEALRLTDLDRTRVETAQIMSGSRTPNEVRRDRNWEPYTGENAEFGNTPSPKWNSDKEAQLQQASTSLSLPGSQGGRDQSESGESQLVDTTGTREAPVRSETLNLLREFINDDN